MEIEKVLEQLMLLNELRTKDKEELIKKYSKTAEGYEKFIHLLHSMIYNRTGFIFDSFDKIKEVVSKGMDENKLSEKVKRERNSILSTLIVKKSDQTKGEQTNFFYQNIGVTDINDEPNLIKNMIEAGTEYYKHSDEDTTCLDLILQSPLLSRAKEGLFTLCNNPYFLYFANCVLLSSNKVDDKFIEDVENIMWHSSVPKAKQPTDINKPAREKIKDAVKKFKARRKYNRLNRYTKINIAQYRGRVGYLGASKKLKNNNE